MRHSLRADALRNRARLLAAARACFTRAGAQAQMDEIAAAAGVGVGTLYRHFPAKDDLLAALIAERLEQLLAVANARSELPAWEQLVAFLTHFVKTQAADRAWAYAMSCEVVSRRPETRDLHGCFVVALGGLMEAAVAAGDLREDVGVDDVLRLVTNSALTDAGDAWRCYLRVVLDGLRTRLVDAPAQAATTSAANGTT
jgi:AcrR family transcriptional regulator